MAAAVPAAVVFSKRNIFTEALLGASVIFIGVVGNSTTTSLVGAAPVTDTVHCPACGAVKVERHPVITVVLLGRMRSVPTLQAICSPTENSCAQPTLIFCPYVFWGTNSDKETTIEEAENKSALLIFFTTELSAKNILEPRMFVLKLIFLVILFIAHLITDQ